MTRFDSLVSVLLSSSGRPHLLAERAIPSVLAQSYPHWELIVVSTVPDGGRTARVVASFGDPRIRCHEAFPQESGPPDGGQDAAEALAVSRRRAEEVARGEVLALLDEDCEFLPNHLDDCIAALTSTDADLVYGKVRTVDPNLGRRAAVYLDWESPQTRGQFSEGPVFSACSVAYRAAWRETGVPAGTDADPDHAKWVAMREAGARFTSIGVEQAIDHGGRNARRIQVSLPSLPPVEELHAAVDRIAESHYVSNFGPYSRELESVLAEYLGVDNVIATASGDTALGMAFTAVRRAMPGRREVVVPSYTFPSTVNAILRAGLEPVFCDVDPLSLGLTPELAERRIGPATAAVVPVHSHGIPADMPALEKLAERHGVMLVSDAAAALGASIDGRRIGSFGDIEVFSLSGTKVLTSGEGGAIACRNPELAQQLRGLGRYGLGENYECVDAGGVNGRMPELAAAMALAGMRCLDSWLARRRDSAALYRKLLDTGQGLRVVAPADARSEPTWKDISVVTPSVEVTEQLAARLAAYRVETRPYYRPLHRMRAYAHLAAEDLPVTEQIADRLISVPISNEIPDSTVRLVAGILLTEFGELTGQHLI
ncbi:DegT/DnrJ/EryC1/StrS family aminotransferase [Streptomyces sp. NBC_01142]|uniref:aminotransferase class I/II-fold pyridoxal phosphate-dependent enzyme n=1 Tax=Streptomyces sp. NBC_01142 TaxID=2975865 RepID=UPI0022529E77|nr:aminotransferase class I/II-fold pyridoxal phosphate-dependent enzyme [Streptomyces sp. NBC_01142]MCX4824572.1 DegT/DnrJ/EryC1/StrS family aminotransferase [Streptomyces sp. NBC_01142]